MNTKYTGAIIVALTTALAVKLLADECNSDQYTVGPHIQDAECVNGCTSINISPTYQHVCADNECTKLVFTGDGTSLITITETKYFGTCLYYGSTYWCQSTGQTTNDTFTVKPLNFSTCNCPG